MKQAESILKGDHISVRSKIDGTKERTFFKLVKAVEDVTGIQRNHILSRWQKKEVVDARAALIQLMIEERLIRMPRDLCYWFTLHRCSFYHYFQRNSALMATDDSFKELVRVARAQMKYNEAVNDA